MNAYLIDCPITGLATERFQRIGNEYLYYIDVNGRKAGICLPYDYLEWDKDKWYRDNKHLIAGLLLNEELYSFEDGHYFQPTIELLKKRLAESTYPVTPQEKYDNLFLKLFKRQKIDGEKISLYNNIEFTAFYKKCYFKNPEELIFYAQSIRSDGLAEIDFRNGIVYEYSFTFKGLSHAIHLESEGKQSKNCFVAMSFGENMGGIREAIKEACLATGYAPIIIDEIHHDSDTTINDAIIANLKKSRFCIADFTEQKKGVYFESGFALGQGKQVIYSCRKDSFDDSHFDTNHFPHILYDTDDELKKALINKIEAWIR